MIIIDKKNKIINVDDGLVLFSKMRKMCSCLEKEVFLIKQGSNCNQAMDFRSNSISSNLVPNSMSVPSCPILHYHQEKNREVKSFSLNSNYFDSTTTTFALCLCMLFSVPPIK